VITVANGKLIGVTDAGTEIKRDVAGKSAELDLFDYGGAGEFDEVKETWRGFP